ncbi:hypothetical protein [Agrobacterium larrymoorei]|uniref:Uncharacterized protein n=1 Tax=Agrobacterium larrymoorei TaxID=160699 RepID=A0ABU0UDY5_9HYPH|nr:hypothetical protein [Agrobacterium larrymoorei]MDQ1183152.1 hypothetical protein [Agrobacterium larrymoorei]
MRARLTKFFAKNVMASAVSFTLLYLWLLLFLHGSAFTSPGNMADEIKLNIIGDSVGGLTAPLALIWLIAAVVSQRQELNLTKSELQKTADAMSKQVELMKEQSELQKAVASANIKQTWFQERFTLYRYFKTVGTEIYGNVSSRKIKELNDHILKVWFVFGKEVSIKGQELFVMVSTLEANLLHHEDEFGDFPPFDEEGQTPMLMSEDENASVHRISLLLSNVWSELQVGQFMQAIEARLELDDNIELKSVAR